MAKDKYHDIVKQALQNDGWLVTDEQFKIYLEEYRDVFIDMAAEKLIQATKGKLKIAVEVKSFIGISPITDLYEAIGKYDVYHLGLNEKEPDRVLYLAVPTNAWEELFSLAFAQKLIKLKQLRLIIYDIAGSKIVKWVK
ncbi:MAG: element excision factor XisH family protein [Bacteroidota bacterium]